MTTSDQRKVFGLNRANGLVFLDLVRCHYIAEFARVDTHVGLVIVGQLPPLFRTLSFRFAINCGNLGRQILQAVFE
jgi:hypothetical protein